MRSILSVLLSATLLAAFSGGCSSLDMNRLTGGSPRVTYEDASKPAVRALCVWQEAQGQSQNGQTARGFGGQIYFFNAVDSMPVVVDGDVRIFLFDDEGTPEEQAKPIGEFDFPREMWRGMLHDSQFGPAFSVFIPYPKPGYHEVGCSLRLRLTRPDGSKLFSEIASLKLSGAPRPDKTPRPAAPALDADSTRQFITEWRDQYTPEPIRRGITIGTEHAGGKLRADPPAERIQNGTAYHSVRYPAPAPAPVRNSEPEFSDSGSDRSQQLAERDARIRELEDRLFDLQAERPETDRD